MSNLSVVANPQIDQSLSEMTEEETSLFAKVPNDGTSIGNKSLRQALTWDEERYWKVRDELVNRGCLATGQGRGGSVYRLKQVQDQPSSWNSEQEIAPENKGSISEEKQLYGPFSKSLEKWARELQFNNYFVEVTASQGSRRTGGAWTRPDVVLVSVETFQYVPNKYLEVVTFEIKPAWSWNISAVFETASHSRFASRSYLAMHNDKNYPVSDEIKDRVEEECKRFGVGLVIFDDPANYDTYNFVVEPIRRAYDPREVEKFMEQVSQDNRQKLSKWLR